MTLFTTTNNEDYSRKSINKPRYHSEMSSNKNNKNLPSDQEFQRADTKHIVLLPKAHYVPPPPVLHPVLPSGTQSQSQFLNAPPQGSQGMLYKNI